MNDLTSFVI